MKEKLNNLPDKPGVYVMLSEENEIIYIGKAKILKNRVRQYFHSPKHLTEKVIAMVNKINDFYYYITNSESDALVLESNLIKKYKPQYNILLKDDKNYPYVKIDRKKPFPLIEITRRLKKDGAQYFGPYMGGVSVKDMLNVIYEGFHLRSCSLNFNRIPKNQKPCLNFQIGRCDAPCVGNISAEEYDKKIDDVIKFLKGDTERVQQLIFDKMQKCAETEMFERAIEMRNMLNIIDKIKEKKLSALPKNIDLDIFAFATDGINRVITELIVRQGRMQGGQSYSIVDFASTESEALLSFIMQFYEGAQIPDEIISSLSEEENAQLKSALSSKSTKRFNIFSPKAGIRKGLLDICKENAEDFLAKSIDKIKVKQDMTVGATELLAGYIGVKSAKRLECFDISNISGVDKVASMVVFENGEKKTSDYRRFKINTVEGANDFASMKEVLTRRLTRLVEGDKDSSFSSIPDVIVVDGGKGQIKYAMEAMDEVGLSIPLISLAEKNEEIYFPNREDPLCLPRTDNALKLLQRLRDEAHRFAITYFRSLHNKNSLSSKLDQIIGVGKEKKKAVLEKFKTVQNIKNAKVEDLMTVDGIGKVLAQNIYDFFNK